MKNKKLFSPQKKDRIKIIRSIIQGIILISLLIIIIKALFTFNEYLPINEEERTQVEEGFIALSYFGVDRSGDKTLISTQRLDEHLKALKDSGYVTITQEDILDYYAEGTPLPPKALFLILEDGRKDTIIFSQKILEKYNFKGTILTYAQNLEKNDPKFLTSKDLKELEENSFWEFGTNGYRLEYINVFDRYNNFLNTLNTYEFQRISSYLERDYNHYLMDYIRNKRGIPMEDLAQMQERIAYDYMKLEGIYTGIINKVPDMYILMHSNTGQFGSNDKVSRENEKWIEELFKLNFNREGNSQNIDNSSIYDLTRIQPQAYWYTNHLLMRIWDDTNQDLEFVSGDLRRKADWDTLEGESEFIKETIVLTSLPKKRGLMRLKESENFKDINLFVELKGNKVGLQTVYLRASEDLNHYIAIQLKDNTLSIYDKSQNQKPKELLFLDLNIHDEVQLQSKEENKLDAEIRGLETRLKYAVSVEDGKEIKKLLNEKQKRKVTSIGDDGEKYVPKIGISEPGNRLLDITLVDNQLSIFIDKKLVTDNLEVSRLGEGPIYIESAFSGYGYSQRNLADDVYDGVFENLMITKVSEGSGNKAEVLYDNRLKGFERVVSLVELKWNEIINWFIKTL